MKSLLIIFNLLLACCATGCIDTELSPLWAVAVVVAWLGVAAWLLKYASPAEALRALVKVRRVWRSLWRPKFDFEAFNRKFERDVEEERRLRRAVLIEDYYQRASRLEAYVSECLQRIIQDAHNIA